MHIFGAFLPFYLIGKLRYERRERGRETCRKTATGRIRTPDLLRRGINLCIFAPALPTVLTGHEYYVNFNIKAGIQMMK